MNGCGNFSFHLVSNIRAHLAQAVSICRAVASGGNVRPILGWSEAPGGWLILWDWLDHAFKPRTAVTRLPAPMHGDAAIVSFVESWLDASPMVVSRPDLDGGVEDDAFEIAINPQRRRGEVYRPRGDTHRSVEYPDVGEVFSIRRTWSEYHK